MANELETLLIGGVTYDVSFVEGLKDFRDDSTFKKLHGDVGYASQDIRIEDKQHEDAKRVTVLHEAIHVILHNAGQGDHPESMVIALGFGLYDLLRNNDDLIAFLGLLPEDDEAGFIPEALDDGETGD